MKKIDIKIVNTGPRAEIQFDPKIYSLDTIKKASYKFTDRCSFEFQAIAEEKILVSVNFLFSPDVASQNDIINQIHNEILDQDLRQTVARETEQVRNLILANAFSNTKLIEPNSSCN